MCRQSSASSNELVGAISFGIETDCLQQSEDKREELSQHDLHETSDTLISKDGIKKLRVSRRDYLRLIIKPDKDGDNLLLTAIILGKTKLAMLLINLIPDYMWLSRHNREFQTALHLATLIENLTIVRRLVVGGAKVHKQDRRGNTALHIACLHGLLNIAKALLAPVTYSETKLNSYEIPYQPLPQDLEIRNEDGLTCFLIATINRNRDMMDILIENEADINAFDMKSGKTCLHILAEYGASVLMKHVLSIPRVHVDARTYSGYTSMQIADFREHNQIMYWLRRAGAKESASDNDSDVSD